VGTNKVEAIKSRSGKIHRWDPLLQLTLCGQEIVKKRIMSVFVRQITCPACLEKIRENAGNVRTSR
jgi:hypothetical protein